MDRQVNKVIIHHSADSTKEPQLEKIDRYHRERAFPKSSLGYWVGYHFLIEKDGRMIQTRRESEIGAHDKDENNDSLGVCLVGNFDIELPTDAQIATLGRLLHDLLWRHHLSFWAIEPHRIGDATSCYGSRLDNNWARCVYLRYEIDLLNAKIADMISHKKENKHI